MILLPTAYLGNIEYFKIFAANHDVIIDIHEHYNKQTYRNRCTIYGANGKLDLIIHIVKGKNQRKSIKETKIANSDNWQKIHWRSIESAYRTSPYFEFYEHEFNIFYNKKYNWLLDLNNELTDFILKKIYLNTRINFTTKYEQAVSVKDYRNYFNPKQNNNFKCQTYNQVFENKFGFIVNLSIIDLLFNKGPEVETYIKQTVI